MKDHKKIRPRSKYHNKKSYDAQLAIVRELLEQAEDPERYYIEVIMQDKIKLYLDYVENSSFWYDIKLIFKTFWVIVKER